MAKRKPHVIQCKIGNDDTWDTWARYKTKGAMREALRVLTDGRWGRVVKFRPFPTEE